MATALKISAPEDKASRFISKTHKLLINGKWVDAASGKTFPTYNPATGEVLDVSVTPIGKWTVTSVRDRISSGTFTGAAAPVVGDVVRP